MKMMTPETSITFHRYRIYLSYARRIKVSEFLKEIFLSVMDTFSQNFGKYIADKEHEE